MRFYVTGGAGFIGSNLVRALLSGGHDVMVVDDLSTGRPENLDPRAGFRKLDIVGDELAGHLAEFAPEIVVHLAAQSSVTMSLKDPERDRLVNAEGTRRVAAAAASAGVRRVISASSAAVYGEPAELPLKESSATVPINPYGASKLEAEGLLADALASADTDHVSLRFSNVYGPRQDAQGEGGVVAIFLSRVAQGLEPVIFGDGSQTRDFIFVGDIVAAIVQCAVSEGMLAATAPALNISTGDKTSLNELVGAIRQSAAYFGPVRKEEPRAGDIEHSVLDPTRALEVLGWSSNVQLETGIALTWRWFSSQQ